MDMMYMPDALNCGHLTDGSGTGKAEAPQRFNIASMSFDPEQIYQEIKKHVPDFEMVYEI